MNGGLKQQLTRIPITLVLCIILAAEAFCAFRVHTSSKRQETLKKEEATANNVTFGLLSVTQWRDKIAAAVTDEIRDFELTPEEQRDLKKEITQLLVAVVHHTDSLMNRPKRSLGGKAKKLVYHLLVNPKKLDKEAPGFADKIVDKLKKPSSVNRIKRMLESKVQHLRQHIYDTTDRSKRIALKRLMQKYQVTDIDAFNKKNHRQAEAAQRRTDYYVLGTIGTILLLLLLWRLLWGRREYYTTLYVVSILSALILLIVGLSTPMIEVDARIANLQFQLVNEQVQFKNQVLFFQSKSIIDVVVLLIKSGKYDTVAVGILILGFSVLFPVAKLICSGIILFKPETWGKNKIVSFFAFKSGKWSMADVMVVAIIMAYIGFNGIITSALGSLNIHQQSLTSITTNHTTLQPGYMIFVSFVFYSLLLSKILQWINEKKSA